MIKTGFHNHTIVAMKEEMKPEEKGEEKETIGTSVTMIKSKVPPEITEMIENPGMGGIEGKPEITENAGIQENLGTLGIHGTQGIVVETIKKIGIRGTYVLHEIHMTTERESVANIRKKSSIWRKHVAMEEPTAEKIVRVLKLGRTQEVKLEMNPEHLEEVEEEVLN